MSSIQSQPTASVRLLAFLLVPAVAVLGCPPQNPPLPPRPGLIDYQQRNLLPVPGGFVNVAGGNLVVPRVDLSIDTHLGTRKLGATWNGATRSWRWSFAPSYDGVTFVDPSGAVFETSGVADGAALPGSVWRKLDASRIRSKGGLVHEFDGAGRLALLRWASAEHPRLEFVGGLVAGETRTVAVRQCTSPGSCDTVYSIGHDAAGRVTSLVDRAGRIADFGYDAAGRLIQARDGLDTARGWPGMRYEYDGDGSLSAIVNSEGERIEYSHAGGRLSGVRQVGAGDPTHSLYYEGAGADGLYVTRHVGPAGEERRYHYDADGRLATLALVSLDEVHSWSWQGMRPAVEILPNGAVTSCSWTDDDVTSCTDPSGNVRSMSYAPTAVDRDAPYGTPLVSSDDTLGSVEQRSYDASGRLLTISNGEGETTAFSWAADDTLATLTTPSGGSWSFSAYGAHGHATQVTSNGQTRTRRYDTVGNLEQGDVFSVPESGGVLARSHDEDRNVVAVELISLAWGGSEASETTLTIERRSDGAWSAIRRPGLADHERSFDALGRPVERRERVDGQWQATGFEYDANGRLVATSLPNGMRREQTWDPAGRPATRRLLRDGVEEGSATWTWSGGQLAALDDSIRGASEVYSYDAAGRRVASVHPDGEQTLESHDLRSRITGIQYVSAGGGEVASLTRAHDLADREVELWHGSERVLARDYTAGQLAATTTGNGLVRSHQYDPSSGELTATTTVDAAGAVVETTAIARTANVTAQDLQVTTTAMGVTTLEGFWLAPAHLVNPPSWNEAGKRVVQFFDGVAPGHFHDYDALSNRLDQGEVYNGESNRLLSTTAGGGLSYAYDAAGFVTERAGVPLGWHASGRIASIGPDSFEWDVSERPIRSQVGGITTEWRFGGALLADAQGTPAVLDLGEVRIDLGAGSRRYRHLDFRGNVKLVSDDAGEIVTHHRYDAYGLAGSYGDASDPTHFANRPDLGNGLMLLGARIYDPATGRFLSQDPVFQLYNQYTYTLGNPVWFTDRDGLNSTASAISSTTAAFVSAIVLAATPGPIGIAFAIAFAVEGGIAAYYWAQVLGGGGGGGGGLSCAPSRLHVPGLEWRWLWKLALIQLLIGIALLWRARRRQAERAR